MRDGYDKYYDAWNIKEDEFFVYGSTNMDNFDIGKFLNTIGVNPNAIKWDD